MSLGIISHINLLIAPLAQKAPIKANFHQGCAGLL